MTRNPSNQRPILKIARSPISWMLEIAVVAGIFCIIVITLQSWANLPNSIPIHFEMGGKPDATGSKKLIWLFPSLSILVYVAFTVLRQFPHTFNYIWGITEQNVAKQYQLAINLLDWNKAEFMWIFAFIEWQIIQISLGHSAELTVDFFRVVMPLFLVTNGLYFLQAYQAR
ncbi:MULTISPECIES: DUF1648 domain-containing protein [Cyanophyceae]|uniref:DUF1648 domain-containing protein n=1 Tax=Cyanophyceae TaxID=3028117 RepID=UPI001688772A|nr:DUF1648 domain-containing protein [Trichocoleus sp. FACHB-69]MBD1935215.1 DUF1648 domain-containing protein [Trichocoleus sp. FACHB-69]